MKTKISILFLFTILCFTQSFSQPYKTQLEKINKYLKTFDNGYYGYLEIKDGYLYDRFRDDNNYCRAKLSDIGNAYEQETSRKVELPCKGTDNCLFSTFTNQYYNSFSFSQSTDFNSNEFITLLNNLVATYNKTNASDAEWVDEDFELSEKQKKTFSNLTDKPTINNTSQKNNTSGNYESALKKLNDYLKSFDNGYYGYFEVIGNDIYMRFKAGKYNKFKMEDMQGAVIQEEYKRVILKCKGDNKCISTDWKENGKEEYSQFTTGNVFNYKELADLLNNFRDAYSGKKQTSTNNSDISVNKSREQQAKDRKQSEKVKPTINDDDDLDEDWDALEKAAAPLAKISKETNKNTSSNYQTALKNLNEYLKTFNPETYRDAEVKDGKVYFTFFVFGANYKSSIDISELKNNTNITIGKSVGSSVVDEVKIFCKGGSKCFYSTYSNGKTDHFRFFSHTVKDFTKMEQLLKEFINTLK